MVRGAVGEQSAHSMSTPLTRPPLILPLYSAPSASTPLTQPPLILPLRLRPLCTGGVGGEGEQCSNVNYYKKPQNVHF